MEAKPSHIKGIVIDAGYCIHAFVGRRIDRIGRDWLLVQDTVVFEGNSRESMNL